MAKELQISDAEWAVMEPIWAAGACTAAEVIKQLRTAHDWNHSTIRTLLARLVEKGALEYEVDGSRYIYRVAVSRLRCVRQEGQSLLEKVFGGDVAALLTHFVEESSLDRDQIEQLRRLLAEKKGVDNVSEFTKASSQSPANWPPTYVIKHDTEFHAAQ